MIMYDFFISSHLKSFWYFLFDSNFNERCSWREMMRQMQSLIPFLFDSLSLSLPYLLKRLKRFLFPTIWEKHGQGHDKWRWEQKLQEGEDTLTDVFPLFIVSFIFSSTFFSIKLYTVTALSVYWHVKGCKKFLSYVLLFMLKFILKFLSYGIYLWSHVISTGKAGHYLSLHAIGLANSWIWAVRVA